MPRLSAICFDWGGTLMPEGGGPDDVAMARWPTAHRVDGATETVASLACRFTLCVATNASVSSRAMVELALERVGLAQHFTHVFCFTELGLRKEDPRFWRTVTGTLGLPADAIAMVGDSWEPDVVAPAAAGLFAVWFDPFGRPAPDERFPRIADLCELEPLLDQWERSDGRAS